MLKVKSKWQDELGCEQVAILVGVPGLICSYAYLQAWCVSQCRRHQWRFCSIRKQKDGTSFSAIRIDCNKYRCRKGLFYCGIEINILKFRYILQIQLTTHAINSLEGLICLLFYRVTLLTRLQQIKKLAAPLTAIVFRHRIPWTLQKRGLQLPVDEKLVKVLLAKEIQGGDIKALRSQSD